MSLRMTDNGPPIVQASVCLQKFLFIVKITSVANFLNKRLKMSFEHIGFNLSLLYI